MSPALEAALVLFSQVAVVALAVILIATSDGEGCTPGPYCEDCPFPRCEDSKKIKRPPAAKHEGEPL